MTNDQLNILAGVASSIGILIGTWFMIIKLIKPLFVRLFKLFDTWESFIKDWAGEDAAPGRDRIPGVMERLNRIDGELKHNGGSSIKDQVARLEKELKIADQLRKETNSKIDEIHDLLTKKSTKASKPKNS
jgi:hypothetical protein